jgi:predicted membrane channel-forming protein YqfA (hemolysin III family)
LILIRILRNKGLETFLYVLVATLPYIGIITMNDRSGMPWMILGGLVYGIGAVFFVSLSYNRSYIYTLTET